MSLPIYILRRILFAIPLILGITIVSFIIANAVPADPINANLPQNALNDPELVAAFRERWGLDKPPIEQYFIYLGNLLQGDLGVSIKTKNPILEDIQQFLQLPLSWQRFPFLLGSSWVSALGLFQQCGEIRGLII
jgi:peptide/nickel transport system permease protein